MRIERDGVVDEVELGSAGLSDGIAELDNWVEMEGETALVGRGANLFAFRLARVEGVGGGAAADGAILSPMPGRIIAVEVAAGASVAKGQKLVTLEAMKMEHSLVAPFDGTVAELNAVAGGQVSEGALLVRVEKGD